MPVKFIAIYQDPWVNNTNEFVLILGCYHISSSGGSGVSYSSTMYLTDPEGNQMLIDAVSVNDLLGSSATAYPYTFSNSFSFPTKRNMLIPPGWTLNGHIRAIGLQGTLEELKGYF